MRALDTSAMTCFLFQHLHHVAQVGCVAVFLVLAAQKVDDGAMVVGQRDALLGGDGVDRLLAQIGFQQIAVVVGFLLDSVDRVCH
jgi:hypothetical protein